MIVKFRLNMALVGLVLKSTIFWDIMPCSPLKVIRRFGGTSPPSSGSKNKPSKKPVKKQVVSRAILLKFH
jgi:hypothetical protein